MTVTAKVIAHSISEEGVGAITMEWRNPRFIHSENMTHKVMSKNASSSRAIPLTRSRAEIRADPAYPEAWGANQRGMQAGEDLAGWRLALTRGAWDLHRHVSLFCSWLTEKAGAHKQIGNRLTEAHSHITLVVTSVYWDNYLSLRDHPAADPTIQALAREVRKAITESTATLLAPGEWHLPYVLPEERHKYHIGTLKQISAARCARVSYNNHGTNKLSTVEQDKALVRQLMGTPMHASPFEHQLTPDRKVRGVWLNPHLHGNTRGYIQQRKCLPNEATMEQY